MPPDIRCNGLAVYRPNVPRTQLAESDRLTGEDVVPEFSVPVSEIFE